MTTTYSQFLIVCTFSFAVTLPWPVYVRAVIGQKAVTRFMAQTLTPEKTIIEPQSKKRPFGYVRPRKIQISLIAQSDQNSHWVHFE